jgi:hypothetical protein
MRASQVKDRRLDAERVGPGYHVAQDAFALGGGTALASLGLLSMPINRHKFHSSSLHFLAKGLGVLPC